MTELEKYATAFHENNQCRPPYILEEAGALMKREVRASDKLQFRIFRIEPNGANVFPYFRHDHGLNSICDYFVFIETADLMYAFAVELKKKDGSPNKQLKRSEVFLNFFRERMLLSDSLQPEKKLVVGKIVISDKTARPVTRNNGIEFDADRVARLYRSGAVYLDLWLAGLDRTL
ncbi:MAG: hypothetical protein K2F72_03340 [Muribaculaceae bacterium]|nr:hypothetical protein [Muribaculaceae bacterium]